LDETSQPLELLLSVTRDDRRTLGSQIEDQFRSAIREGVLRSGARVPSTRDLARQLGVSRRITVDAYAQLAAEGYLSLRQGARPRVSDAAVPAAASGAQPLRPAPPPRFDFRPSMPDVSTFPRTAWLRSLREALATIADADLAYGDPRPDSRRCAARWPSISGARAASSRIPRTSSSRAATRRAWASSVTPSRRPARSGSRSRTRPGPSRR
jgi:GntR family transcriptional regulator/MocR family aminotransferase